MTKSRLPVSTLLLSVLLSAAASFSCQMCLTDAFQLTVNPTTLLAWSVISAVVCSAVFLFRRSGWISMALLLVGLLLILYFRYPLLDCANGMIYAITKVYAKAYSTIVPYGYPHPDPSVCLILLGIPLCWLTARTVILEGSVLLVIMGALPFLILCLIIINVAPVLWLTVFTGIVMLLLVSQSVRDQSAGEGSRLAWLLLLPTALLIAAITWLWPPETYERSSWSEQLQQLTESELPFRPTQSSGTQSAVSQWNPSLKQLDLESVGPKSQTGTPAFRYYAETQLKLLRGVSLGIYKDNSWSAVPEDDYAALKLTLNPLTMTGWSMSSGTYTLQVETFSIRTSLLTPYGMLTLPEGSEAVDDAYAKNTDRIKTYTVSYRQTDTGMPPSTSPQMQSYDAFVQDTYTQIPADLQKALLDIAREAGLTGQDRNNLPAAVGRYIRNSGVYDLNTTRVPEGKDFVLYFLQESHRGYCVHFATAATMMLRALGLPARYVTGYSVSAPEGQWTTVTEDDAHAWVEYYAEGIGWLPLDPTPASVSIPDVTVPDEPEQTPTQPETPPQSPDTPDAPEQEQPQPQQPQEPTEPEQEQPAPVTPDTPSEAPADASPGISAAWLWLLLPPGLAALILLRRKLILSKRLSRCRSGHPNRRALRIWRWLLQLSRLSGEEPAVSLLKLAEKAKFSQHTLTEEEVQLLWNALEQQQNADRRIKLLKRFWYRYGLALY